MSIDLLLLESGGRVQLESASAQGNSLVILESSDPYPASLAPIEFVGGERAPRRRLLVADLQPLTLFDFTAVRPACPPPHGRPDAGFQIHVRPDGTLAIRARGDETRGPHTRPPICKDER